VSNVNEKPPVITSNGGGASAAVSVAENSKSVTTVVASDADRGDTPTFSISGGADAAKFKINVNTGALVFKTAPNFEAPTDQGGQQCLSRPGEGHRPRWSHGRSGHRGDGQRSQ
jgi:hypothetical protein